MKITDNGYEIRKYIGETALGPDKDRAEKTSSQAPASTGDTVVNLSDASREVQKAREVIESEPDIRREEVNAIRKQIENGTYQMDPDKTAEQMLGQFIDELVG